MPTLDRREQYTDNEPGDEQVEEAKDAETTTVDETDAGSEETSPEDSSTSNDEESDATDGTTDDTKTGTEDGESDEETTRREAIAALKIEEERLKTNIVSLRGERRDLRSSPPAPVAPIIVPKDELADVDPQSIDVIEKVLRSKGYVRKEEVQAIDRERTIKSVQEEWLEVHPEYKPENDAEDKKWNDLVAVTRLFATPSNPKDMKRILDIAHRELNPSAALPSRSRAEVAAKNEKIRVSSKTGTGGSGVSAKPAQQPSRNNGQAVRSGLIGFTEEELDELGI